MIRRFLPFLMLMLSSLAALGVERDIYNPLGVGLRWDVDVEVTPLSGIANHGTAVREILGTKKIDQYLYFVVITSFKDLPEMKEFTMYRRKSTKGIYAISAVDKDKQEHLEAALPLTVGQVWKTIVSGQVITTQVEGTETVKAGDRTFENCVKISYKSGDGKFSGTYFQAPDVGNVLETMNISGVIYKFTLKKFSGLK